MSKSLRPTPWPTIPWLSTQQMRALLAQMGGQEKLFALYTQREQQIALEQQEPLDYGHEVAPGWAAARRLMKEGCRDLLILGGRRSSKTEFAAKLVNELARSKPGAQIQCWSQNETTSIDRQQTYVFRYLPGWMRSIKKLDHTELGKIKVSHTRVTGFSDRVILHGRGTVTRFFTYQAYRNDPTLAEGAELDFCWLDEMAPASLVETLRFCLVSRGGTLIQTFTPMLGYTETVSQYLDAAEVDEWREAELLLGFRLNGRGPAGQMPYVLRCFNKTRRVIFFFTQDNPYPPGNYERLKEELAEAAQEDILTKGYGWPTKRTGVAFRKFSERVHVIPHEQVPAELTRYVFIDPGGAKNWFIVWLGMDSLGRIYVYREWPDITLGEWALPGGSAPGEKPDGRPGPAQRAGGGGGVHTYKRLLASLEGGADIFARCMDPRFGNATVPGQEDGTNLIQLMLEPTPASSDGAAIPGMIFEPWPACAPCEAVDLIAPWLDYDDEQPITALNCPKLYVSERCQNMIFALKVWTGLDGERGATKDPIDCLRGAAKRGLDYIQEGMIGARGGGCGY